MPTKPTPAPAPDSTPATSKPKTKRDRSRYPGFSLFRTDKTANQALAMAEAATATAVEAHTRASGLSEDAVRRIAAEVCGSARADYESSIGQVGRVLADAKRKAENAEEGVARIPAQLEALYQRIEALEKQLSGHITEQKKAAARTAEADANYAEEPPRSRTGLWATIGFVLLTSAAALALSLWLAHQLRLINLG